MFFWAWAIWNSRWCLTCRRLPQSTKVYEAEMPKAPKLGWMTLHRGLVEVGPEDVDVRQEFGPGHLERRGRLPGGGHRLLDLRVARERPAGGLVRRMDGRRGGQRLLEDEHGPGGEPDQAVELLGDLGRLARDLIQRLLRLDRRHADLGRLVRPGELLGITHLKSERGLDPLGPVQAVERLGDAGEELTRSLGELRLGDLLVGPGDLDGRVDGDQLRDRLRQRDGGKAAVLVDGGDGDRAGRGGRMPRRPVRTVFTTPRLELKCR